MQFTRFLRNDAVTVPEMAAHAAAGTAERVAGREIVAIQDTSELALGGRRARASGYGPVAGGGAVGGLLLHPVLAVDARSGALVGLVDVTVWNRTQGPVGARRKRPTQDKESLRWIEGTVRAGAVLAQAAQITVVSDRESDFYELFALRPDHVHQIVRACQNRRIGTGDDATDLLFSFVDALPEHGRLVAEIPAAPLRAARVADLAIRFSRVDLRKPEHGAPDLPETVPLTLVDIRETTTPQDSDPIHWRLLTTHAVSSLTDAQRILDLYRMRWIIEEFFRTLKTAGFQIEDADISDPQAMMNLVAAATIAAVTVKQLVRARDGTTDQPVTDAFDPDDQPILEALSTSLEGKTARQKNPHPKGSLAFAAWVIARLGGWTGYYGKPGPLVMRRGLDDYQRVKLGTTLRINDV